MNVKKLVTGLMVGALAITSIFTLGATSASHAAEDEGTLMHRLYNPYSGEHFYTANEGEKNICVDQGWNYEGVGFVAPSEGEPVYRLFNKLSGDHHYTLDENEKNWLVKEIGWTYEGIGWYSKETGDKCEKKMYRLFNPYAQTATHHYTFNEGEKNWLVSIGWIDEGTSWVSMHEVYMSNYSEATCSKEGYSGDTKCVTCDKVYEGSVIPKNPNKHNFYHHDAIETADYRCRLCNFETNDGNEVFNHIDVHGDWWDARMAEGMDPNDALALMFEKSAPYVVIPGYNECVDCGYIQYD